MFFKHDTTVGMTKRKDRFDAAEDQFNHLAVRAEAATVSSKWPYVLSYVFILVSVTNQKAFKWLRITFHTSTLHPLVFQALLHD